MCGKFGLMAHIDNTASRPDDIAWVQADCCVRSWLFGSVAEDILDFTMQEGQTARQLWIAIQELFYANKEPGRSS